MFVMPSCTVRTLHPIVLGHTDTSDWLLMPSDHHRGDKGDGEGGSMGAHNPYSHLG